MTPLMKLIKAGHSLGHGFSLEEEDLERYRHNQDTAARIAAPNIKVTYASDCIMADGHNMELLWAKARRDGDEEVKSNKVILYCHGGGFATGTDGYASVLSGKLAAATGIKAVAYIYRLSPEHEYPSAINDTIAVWNYLLEQGYEENNIIVAGDSAGGNLALELCLHIRDNGMKQPGGLILMSPWTDMTLVSDSYKKYKDIDPSLNMEYMLTARKGYLGERTDYKNPKYSPLFGEFDGFPRTIIQVGSNEILKSDSTRLASRMKRYGVDVRIEIYKDCWHVFQQFPVISAVRAFKNIRRFIERN